jgi:hypothetical protein
VPLTTPARVSAPQAAIKDQLLKSAGANYDLGSNSAGYATNAGGERGNNT